VDITEIQQVLKNRLGLDKCLSRVLVVGLGLTGLSAIRFLHRCGYSVTVADSRLQPPGLEVLQEQLPDIDVVVGRFRPSLFEAASHVLVSPGLSLQNAMIYQSVTNGVTLISDIDLFCCANPAPVVAITGSNGKSTVTSMLGHMAEKAGVKVAVGANLGVPALDLLDRQAELYVLELSSFQLERTTCLDAAAAAVLNITPDHMDRHASLDEYAAAKERIYNGSGVMVMNAGDQRVMAMQRQNRKVLTFAIDQRADFYVSREKRQPCFMYQGQSLMAVKDLTVAGLHNQENALAALALGCALDLPWQPVCEALSEFPGLEHRMQKVAEINGVVWINDSKATNVGACIAALQGYDNKVVLIAGGDAKGAQMHELAKIVQQKVKAVVLIGKDAGLIARALNCCVPVYFEENIKQAVYTAAKVAQTGEHVLLSPACASIDQFTNYRERGQKFIEAVKELWRHERQASLSL